MREILFRGKRSGNGEWVEGVYYKQTEYYGDPLERHYIITTTESLSYDFALLYYDVLPETVGQYTGLTDKNGKKIFEGDIVLFEDESPSNYEYHDCTEMRCGEIRFDDGQFYLTNRIAVEMGDLIYDGKIDGEIIGNIHDNPELLKGGEQG